MRITSSLARESVLGESRKRSDMEMRTAERRRSSHSRRTDLMRWVRPVP